MAFDNTKSKTASFNSQDPDLNNENPENFVNFDEPFSSPGSKTKNGQPKSTLPPFDSSYGPLFKGLNEVANAISEIAEKTAQAAQQAADKGREVFSGTGSDFKPETNRPKLGFDPAEIFGKVMSDPAGFVNKLVKDPALNPFARPVPASSKNGPAPSDTGSARREPSVEIHDEIEEGLILVVAEIPGANEATIQLEIRDDILILKAEGRGFSYDKEILLPASVLSEPVNRNYQNGLLELRLKKV